jgi:site-specific DNA recombinase
MSMSTLPSTDLVRAALYQRVSTADQVLDRQYEENRAAVARNGWQPVEYEDPKQRGASRFRDGGGNREAYDRLVADLSAGKIDVLVLWESSRGDRRLTYWSQVLDTCRKHGVLIHITSQDYTYDLSRARDWKTLAEDGVGSAYESELISMRVKSGKDDGARAGRPQGSIAYGIHRVRDPEKTKFAWLRDEPDPVTGQVAARIVREVGKGTGYRQIADALNADGIPAPRGGRWQPYSLAKIAGNPVYVTVGIVTETEHGKARARLAETASKRTRPGSMRYRYSSVIACGVCGDPLHGQLKNGIYRYMCKASGHVSIPAADADDYLDAMAIAWLCQPEQAGLVRNADEPGARAARDEAARYRRKIAEATDSYNADKITIESLEAITAANKSKAEAAERRARDLEIPSALVGLPDPDPLVVTKRWASMTIAARKAAFRDLAPDAVAMPTKRGHPAPIDKRIILWP